MSIQPLNQTAAPAADTSSAASKAPAAATSDSSAKASDSAAMLAARGSVAGVVLMLLASASLPLPTAKGQQVDQLA